MSVSLSLPLLNEENVRTYDAISSTAVEYPDPMPASLGLFNVLRWALYVGGWLALPLVALRGRIDLLLVWQTGASYHQSLLAFMLLAFLLFFSTHGLWMSMLAFYDWPQLKDRNKCKNNPDFLAKIALVIPCHKANQIIIMDNATSNLPPDSLEEVVRAIDPSIRYVFVPEGRKAQALHIGVEIMSEFQYVLLVDDDTSFPDTTVFDEDFFLADSDVCCINYPRAPVEHNLLTRIIGYQLRHNQGHYRGGICHALAGTTHIAVGTTALYRRDYWLKIMEEHPCFPYGEDLFASSIAISKGYRIAFDMRSPVTTFAPPVLTSFCSSYEREQGYGAATLWKQRALRWSCTGLRNTPFYARNMWKYNGKSFFRRLMFRYIMVRSLLSNCLGVCFPLIVAHVLYVSIEIRLRVLCYALGFSCACSLYHNGMTNYVLWWNNDDYRASFLTVLLTPIVDHFLMVCHSFACYKCLFVDLWHSKYRWRVGCWKQYKGLVEEKKREFQQERKGASLAKARPERAAM